MGGKARRGKGLGFEAALSVFLILSGCASTQETVLLESNLSNLQVQVQELDARIQKLERAVFGFKGSTGSAVGGLAALNARMDQMQMDLGRIRGQVEELRHLQGQASPESSAPKPGSDQPVISIPSVPTPAPGPGTTQPATAAAPAAHALDPEKELYNGAMVLYQKGNHRAALQKFKEFFKRYPTSDLADNALFWMGECHFMMGSYQEAINSYQEVLDRFPKGNKVPHALLKQGAAFEKLGDTTAARILYERVMQQYPKSPQAQVAKKWLDRLK
ncbi:tol-pal system protein YbgF [Desulfosoma caldarium]|uniref:Tol-pal system protein YbgF n=1 Tax=Desulfosoma caldarium TaxID=610254 RepID=A0A3N1VF29_9BACT|nr:tol-pal system protein YbgF [Desulfosoma caldarium]ROR01485.1 tol-pal system protein YbgF [Desulfosoma caldarium]